MEADGSTNERQRGRNIYETEWRWKRERSGRETNETLDESRHWWNADAARAQAGGGISDLSFPGRGYSSATHATSRTVP